MTPIIKIINTYYVPGTANLLILIVNILGNCYFFNSHSVDEELRHGEQVAESQFKLKQFDSRA